MYFAEMRLKGAPWYVRYSKLLVADRLRVAIAEKGLKQTEVAERTGVS